MKPEHTFHHYSFEQFPLNFPTIPAYFPIIPNISCPRLTDC